MTGTWEVDALAAAAQETPERLAWYARAGLLHRDDNGGYAANSLQRLRLIRYARLRGITDEDLALATKEQGDLLGIFEELAPPEARTYDLEQAAAQAGVPAAFLDELVHLLGLEEDRGNVHKDDVDALNLLGQALALGIPDEAMLQLVRVFADATERLADAQARIFHDFVHEQFRASGLSGKQLLESTEAIAKPALTLVEPAIVYFHRRAWQKANREDFLRHLAEATSSPAERPGDTTAAVMFVDLAGFTPLTIALGDHGVADVLRVFSMTVRDACSRHGGRIIKQIGDAFMLVFDRPADAVRFGADLHASAAKVEDLPALHIGAHWGRVLYREGDYYGGGVNLAARIASSTDPDQFLVSSELADAAGEHEAIHYVPLPPISLKGVDGPVAVAEVRTDT
jgi:class 3 adenylate cyclase